MQMKQKDRTAWMQCGVEIGEEVDLARIASDVCIHPGCRIRGAKTSIGSGCVLGAEAPATIENCQLGRSVALKGGFFSGAVFWDGANMGANAHVRAGTILEEEANGAHCVGLKQTILFPFVTLGSLINFCDLLMAGGTSRKDHSEVGSSYIHFNYTPHQDKATPSLLGDVQEGVFLDKRPIFLGGQGGLVGPARIAYGTIIAAGGVCRTDLLEEEQLHIPSTLSSSTRAFQAGVYRKIDRIVKNNLSYIGNLLALREWYRQVRAPIMQRDAFDQACLQGALHNLDSVISERIRRLEDLAEKMKSSVRYLQEQKSDALAHTQQSFIEKTPAIVAVLKADSPQGEDLQARAEFLQYLPEKGSYISIIRELSPSARTAGKTWLKSIVSATEALWK